MSKKDLGRDIFLVGMKKLLAPLATFCLKKGIRIQDIVPELKNALIEAARKDLKQRGEEESISRLSAMTGMQRKEISYKEELPTNKIESADMLSRVLNLWMNQKSFCDSKTKAPKALSYEGSHSEFALLVRKVSSDLNHHTVLFELERAGAAKKDPIARTVSLVREEFITYDDPVEAFELLSRDVNLLIDTVDKNLISLPTERLLHRTTQYDNVYESAVPEIKAWIQKAGKKLHAEARRIMSKYDADTTTDKNRKMSEKKAGVTIGIGTFEFINLGDHENSHLKNKKSNRKRGKS